MTKTLENKKKQDAGRNIIFECRVGSHLYGTNRPSSDDDYSGVFLPSPEDYVSMGDDFKAKGVAPSEWNLNEKVSEGPRNAAGDVDRKYYSLARFFAKAAEGQPGLLEFLFAPDSVVLHSSPEWEEVKKHRSLFLSRGSVVPFIEFAMSQAKKAQMKGANLNLLRDILWWGKTLTASELSQPVKALAAFGKGEDGSDCIVLSKKESGIDQRTESFSIKLPYGPNEAGYVVFSTPFRDFDMNLKTRLFLAAVASKANSYGGRSRKAAESGLDYKSLSHAYRVTFEAEEFIRTGHISLPRPPEERVKLLQIRDAELGPDYPYFEELQAHAERIKNEVLPKSTLPDKADLEGLNALCIKIMRQHLKKQC